MCLGATGNCEGEGEAGKYQEFNKDLAMQRWGWKVSVYPMVWETWCHWLTSGMNLRISTS